MLLHRGIPKISFALSNRWLEVIFINMRIVLDQLESDYEPGKR